MQYNDNVVGAGSPKYDNAYFEIEYVRAYTTGLPAPTMSPSPVLVNHDRSGRAERLPEPTGIISVPTNMSPTNTDTVARHANVDGYVISLVCVYHYLRSVMLTWHLLCGRWR
jgi:hypothetical protein